MAAVVIKKNKGVASRVLLTFVQRFHLILFFVFVVSCLAVAVLLINKTLNDSSSQDYTSTIDPGTIDQATLERIQSHHPSSEATSVTNMPEGRVNPFAE